MTLNVPISVRENEMQFLNRPTARILATSVAARADQFPFAQGVQCFCRNRYRALARVGLRRADFVVSVRALANVQFALSEIHIRPRQAAQFRSAQAAERRD